MSGSEELASSECEQFLWSMNGGSGDERMKSAGGVSKVLVSSVERRGGVHHDDSQT